MKGFKIKASNRVWILAISFSTFLIFSVVLDVAISYYAKTLETEPKPISTVNIPSYPVLPGTVLPVISAKSVIVMDDSSKTVIFARNPNFRFSTASTAKIMTALVALDSYKMDDVLTVSSNDIAPFVMGFKVAEQIKFSDLLYSLLLPSANDAALIIAQNYPGGTEKFVDKMNEKANILHLQNTHFGDPAGLMDDLDYTTVLDLARLASSALTNKKFAQIVSTKHKVFTSSNGTIYSIYNRNKLLGIDGIDGVKTGYTEEAGEVLVTSKVKNGKRFIVAVMGSDDRFLDTLTLLNLVSDKVTYLPIHPKLPIQKP